MKDDLAGFCFDTIIKSLKAKYYLACIDVDTLYEENKKLKETIKYLESFIVFCPSCKNPKDDCIC